jgi:hypothetical protein
MEAGRIGQAPWTCYAVAPKRDTKSSAIRKQVRPAQEQALREVAGQTN